MAHPSRSTSNGSRVKITTLHEQFDADLVAIIGQPPMAAYAARLLAGASLARSTGWLSGGPSMPMRTQ